MIEHAREALEESLAIHVERGNSNGVAATQVALAQLLIMRGENLPRALGLLWEGYTLIERLKSPHEIQAVRNILVGVKSALGVANFDKLWAEALSTPQPDWLTSRAPKPLEEFMGLLRQVYAQGGAGAVRALLRALGLSKAQIETLLRQLSER
jgi:hypothetical protein